MGSSSFSVSRPGASRSCTAPSLVFVSKWVFGPPLATPRRWCAAGALRNVVYVASGIGSQFSADVAKSVEKWNLEENKLKTCKRTSYGSKNKNCYKGWRWEKMGELKDCRFSRDAIDAVGWRGKLCVVHVTAKGGVLYDVAKDNWEDMPEGMIRGWRGPAAAMDEEVIYMVDDTDGALRKYDEETDEWREVTKSELLKGAQHIAAGGGRVCVVSKGVGSGGIVVVNVKASPPRLWVVETPPGYEALTVHILPRMNHPVSDFRYQF
ncbi:F-box/kelch-repeat protein SKIP25-like [Melia azedarach]|uniref:F-box/kelch-repeat protein SKIP25-like n=1 Tax=Melia azedarach TaxID=155640 RepID=A0ACC1Z019_MELAZ|nr:F-box/kelch-repeat protein SKIP25-like [Melia azedarach]